MRLRQAIKICREVFGYEDKNMRDRIAKDRTWSQVQEAKKVCRGRWLDKRIPYIPSEEEEYERAEIFGCLMLDLAQESGVPAEEIDRVKTEFLVKLHESKPE